MCQAYSSLDWTKGALQDHQAALVETEDVMYQIKPKIVSLWEKTEVNVMVNKEFTDQEILLPLTNHEQRYNIILNNYSFQLILHTFMSKKFNRGFIYIELHTIIQIQLLHWIKSDSIIFVFTLLTHVSSSHPHIRSSWLWIVTHILMKTLKSKDLKDDPYQTPEVSFGEWCKIIQIKKK